MGRRYLTEREVVATVARGASVGQFLGFDETTNDGSFRYVVVEGDATHARVWSHHKLDNSAGFLADLGELADADGRESDGYLDAPRTAADPDGRKFDNLGSALDWCYSAFGADPERWVNESMLGDQLVDARRIGNATAGKG